MPKTTTIVEKVTSVPSLGVSGKARRRRKNRMKKRLLRTQLGQPLRSGSVARGFARFNRMNQSSLDRELREIEYLGGVPQNAVTAAQKRSLGPMIARKAASLSLTNEYADIQGAIVAPQIVAPERYSTEYSSNPTAIANPWILLDYPWDSANNPNNAQLPASELLVAVFRDPLRSVVYYDQNAAANKSKYNAFITPISGASAVPLQFLATPDVTDFDEDIHSQFWVADPSGDYDPHGPVLYSGSDDRTEKTYRWFDKGEHILTQVQLTGASTSWGMTVTLDRFEQDAVIDKAVVTSSSGTGTLLANDTTIPESGYYSIHVFYNLGTPTSTGSLNIGSESETSCFCHRALPDFEKNFLAIDGIRIMGVSAMYSNNAAQIQKAGTIVGYQVPKETDWQQFIGSLEKVSKNNASRTMPIENGMYGFLKPTEAEDFELIDEFGSDPVSGSITASYFTLRNVKSYLILRGSIPPVDGRSGFITLAFSVEYMSTDVWRPLDVPRTKPELYKQAIAELKTITQWHENPSHVKEIFRQILSGATSLVKGVAKYSPQILNVAELLGSFLA